MILKVCPDCGLSKKAEEFSRDSSRADGLQYYCKTCYALRAKKSYENRRRKAGKRVRADYIVPDGFKYCFDCGTAKPIDAFPKNRASTTGYAPYCAPCHAARSAEHYLRRKYGLTGIELAALIDAQGGKCAICLTRSAEHVDHDHVTRQIRGVLCFPCNVALGHLKDDVALFRKAIDYLERTTWQKTLESPGVYRLTSPRPAAAASSSSSALLRPPMTGRG